MTRLEKARRAVHQWSNDKDLDAWLVELEAAVWEAAMERAVQIADESCGCDNCLPRTCVCFGAAIRALGKEGPK